MAASKRETSMFIRAAMNMIADQPISFQASDSRTTQGNALTDERKSIGVPPNSLMMSFRIPDEGESRANSTPYMMTQLRKCGRYASVCTVLRSA